MDDKIKFLSHEQIHKDKWDACIESSFNGIIYAYSWYLDIACPRWHALVIGDYQVVMPVPARTKAGIDYVYQPFFIQQLGVFARGLQKLSPDLVDRFINTLAAQYKYIHSNLNTYCKLSSAFGAVTSHGLTHHLDLIHTYEKAQEGYATNLKRNLKKASANELELSMANDSLPIIDLFRKNKGTQVSKLKDADYRTLVALIAQCHQRGKAELYNVLHQGELCAGAVFVESNQHVIFLFSGLNEVGKRLGAMPFIIDSFIKNHSGKNLVLDFEGSVIADLARFYKSFGSQECVYLQVTINNLPAPLKWFKKGTSLQS